MLSTRAKHQTKAGFRYQPRPDGLGQPLECHASPIDRGVSPASCSGVGSVGRKPWGGQAAAAKAIAPALGLGGSERNQRLGDAALSLTRPTPQPTGQRTAPPCGRSEPRSIEHACTRGPSNALAREYESWDRSTSVQSSPKNGEPVVKDERTRPHHHRYHRDRPMMGRARPSPEGDRPRTQSATIQGHSIDSD